MERIQFIEHNGKKILYIDFSNTAPDELIGLTTAAKKVIGAQPEKSLLTLTNVTNARFNKDVTAVMKEYTNHNKPFVKAAALVGLSSLQQVILNAIIVFTGRKFSAFSDLEKAKDWLIKY